jgi:hypothetical protein
MSTPARNPKLLTRRWAFAARRFDESDAVIVDE